MSTRYASLPVPAKALLSARPMVLRKSGNGRPRECLQISSRIVSDILRPVRNVRLVRD